MAQAKGGGLANADVGELIKNPKVQIGLIVAAVVIVLGVVGYNMFANRPATPTQVSGAPGMMDPAGADLPAGMAGGPGSAELMPGAGGSGGFDAGAGAGGFGGDGGFGGGAGGTGGGEEIEKSDSPGVGARSNPFAENPELKQVVASVPVVSPDIAPAQDLYGEVRPPQLPKYEAGDDLEGPPIPPMRVSGIVEGRQIAALLQIGAAHIQVTPGMSVPNDNPVYRVERIEKDRVFLSRRWEYGERRGVQRIEVPLQGDPSAQQGFGGGGFPGAGGAGAPGGGGPGSGGFPGGGRRGLNSG